MILVQNLIYEVRGKKVMLDSDLARLYGIETRSLKQSVRRNIDRFPEDFMIVLELDEYNSLISSRSQFVTLNKPKRGANAKYKPFAFTELGVAMLSSVLNDVRQDIDNLYLAIADLSSRIEEKKNEPRRKIGFQQNIED